MTDRDALVRIAVLQKAILNVLNEANKGTADELKVLVDSEEAIPVRVDGRKLGKVRRNKESISWRVYDWGALERWVKETVPHAWLVRTVEQVDPGLLSAVTKTGEYIDPDGVVHEVPGLEKDVKPGSLNVDTTDDVEEWARVHLGLQLKELE